MKADYDGFELFCQGLNARQVARGLANAVGGSLEDAEDALQDALLAVHDRWRKIANPRAYLYRVARNGLVKRNKQSDRELAFASCSPNWISGPGMAEDTHELDPGFLTDCLVLLTPRQREATVWYLEGLSPREIGDLMAITTVGVRAHLRDGRARLRDALGCADDIHWRAGRAIHQRMRGGCMPDFGLRPVICQSWARSRNAGVRADGGSRLPLLSSDEVRERLKEVSWAEKWVFESLGDLARAHNSMWVVLDRDGGRVLARGGDRSVREAADELMFVVGASWLEETVGSQAAGIVLETGLPAVVSGPEHYMDAFPHQDLTCWAAPIRNREGQTCGALNLTARTGRQPRLRRHILAKVDALARQVGQLGQ